MPMYLYRCKACEKDTEVRRSFDDCMVCPECEHCGDETYKIINADIRTTVSGVRKGNYNSGDLS
jgi:putative FmdB family regulatory protein